MLLPAPSHLPFCGGHCYSCVPVASLHTPASIDTALMRVSHLRPLKWINRLAPVYDAYFSPLKDKYRYWFGAMLLVWGILLVLLTITSVDNPELNVFALFLFAVFLLFFMSVKCVYNRMIVRVLESATLLNLIVLSAGAIYILLGIYWIKVKIAYFVNWNHLCSILCRCVEYDQALSQCWLEVQTESKLWCHQWDHRWWHCSRANSAKYYTTVATKGTY